MKEMLTAVLNGLKDAKKDRSWYWTFRASQLPICPRDFLFWEWTESERRPKDAESFRMDFYCDIGTAVHAVMQKWLGRANAIYGNWACQNPKCNHYDEVVVEDILGVQSCPHCGKETIYEEYQLSHPSGLSAHPDGLLPYDDGYILWEFKTCDFTSKKTRPRYNYLLQTNVYANLLEAKGFDIKAIVIVYISRVHPDFKFFITKPNPKVFEETIKRYTDATQALLDGDFPEGLCHTESDAGAYECVWRKNCFAHDVSSIANQMRNDYKKRLDG
jgi:hypothetical protein